MGSGDRVVGYVRVSTEEQGVSGAGLVAQRKAIKAECERRGWELLRIEEDVLSGRTLNRPGLTQAIDAYVVTASGFLVLDLTTWGWVMMIWGALLALGGLGLLAGQGWARWFAIFVVSLNFFAQLGFLGNSQYPLWALTALALNAIVLYALTARWSESRAEMAPR